MVKNPIYEGEDSMPVYEQVLLSDIPQTTTTTTFVDQTEKATQPGACTNDHTSHQEKEENDNIDHPTQKTHQPVNGAEKLEYSDIFGPDSYDTFFPKSINKMRECNRLNLSLTLDGRDDINSTSGDDGKEAIQEGSASMAKKREAEMSNADKSYGLLTPAGLLN